MFSSFWDLLDVPSHSRGSTGCINLKTFPKCCECYRYMVLLCGFSHSPCLTAWREPLISRWNGKFGASMVLIPFPQSEPSCLRHNTHSRGNRPLSKIQLSHGETTLTSAFGQKGASDSDFHTLSHSIPLLISYPHQVFHFQPEEAAVDFIPGSHRRGSHQNPILSFQGAGRTSSGPTVSHFSGIQVQWDCIDSHFQVTKTS